MLYAITKLSSLTVYYLIAFLVGKVIVVDATYGDEPLNLFHVSTLIISVIIVKYFEYRQIQF